MMNDRNHSIYIRRISKANKNNCSSEKISDQIRDFVDSGGKIQKLDSCEFGKNYSKATKRQKSIRV